MPLDGLLIVDKPVGPTSHDVVARVRRVLRERRVGHTGTLDPLASGVLLLLVGRATRLAQFLNTDIKRYEATIRFGFATDTYDALGQPTTPPHAGPMPARDEIDRALDAFRGTFLQQPPAFSAKRIEGRRSYKLARAHQRTRASVDDAAVRQAVLPPPVTVTVSSLDVVAVTDDELQIAISCSTGFYVRSLAHELGVRLGVGAHLAALRRTAVGGRTLSQAVALAELDDPTTGAERARAALIAMAEVLPDLPAVTLTPDGVRRAANGCDLTPSDLAIVAAAAHVSRLRLLNEARDLVGVADLTPAGLLHPTVILM